MDLSLFFSDLALFFLKAVIIVAAVGILLILAIQAGSSTRRRRSTGLEIEKLNEKYKSFRRKMQSELMDPKRYKTLMKAEKKEDKKTAKGGKDEEAKPRLFVVDFEGDIKASAAEDLRHEVTAILTIAKPEDEVVVRLESGGGMVTSYGLASSQLARVRQKGIKLTICVDKIAASGGYMMACVADKILAAPFAVVGSIGVIAQVPNFHRVLKKHDVDYREVTAGEFKRTVTVLGEITEPGLAKFKSQIEETHELFKGFVSGNRPKLDIAKVATGEYWYGTQALGLGLVDEVTTSDDYLFSSSETKDIFKIKHHGKKSITERFSISFSNALSEAFTKIWGTLDRSRFGL